MTPVLKQIFEANSRCASVLLIHLGAFDFLNGRFGKQVFKQILEEGLRHPLFCHTSLKANKLVLFFNSPWGFPDRGHSPWAPPKGSETGLKPLGNTFRLTISESFCFFGYSIIALFRFLVGGTMCWFFCFGFIAGALSSASFLGKEQSPVSAPKRVGNRSETTRKHLPAHHLRIFASSVTASLLYFVF